MDDLGLVVSVTLAAIGGLGMFAFKQPKIFSDWQWRMLIIEGVVIIALYAFISGVLVSVALLTDGADHSPVTRPVNMWTFAMVAVFYATLILAVISDRIVRDQSAKDSDKP